MGGVAAGETAHLPRGGSRCRKAAFLQHPPDLTGNRRRGVNHPHSLPGNFLDERDDEGVVRAAQHHPVDALCQHGGQGALQDGTGGGGVQFAALDLFHQAGAGILQDGDSGGEALQHGGIKFALEGGGGRQHADHAALSALRGGFDRRFHAHEGHAGEGAAQVVQGGGGGGVARHHDQFCTLPQQKAGDLFGEGPHFAERTRPVGDVSLIGEKDDIFVRQLGADFPQDGEAAHAGVEDANRGVHWAAASTKARNRPRIGAWAVSHSGCHCTPSPKG